MSTQKQNFVDQQLRPIVEILEDLHVRIETAVAQEAILDPPIANDATPYDDGRPDESLDQFTEGNLITVLNGLAAFDSDTLQPAQDILRRIAVRRPF